MIEIKTYLTPSEYEQVKLINLGLEIDGSSDHPDKDAEGMIFRVEQGVINYLTNNYAFEESDIVKNEKTLRNWKLGICDQIEDFLVHGLINPNDISGEMAKPKFLCDGAKGFLRCFMNIRSF